MTRASVREENERQRRVVLCAFAWEFKPMVDWWSCTAPGATAGFGDTRREALKRAVQRTIDDMGWASGRIGHARGRVLTLDQMVMRAVLFADPPLSSYPYPGASL